jgi:large repetitive protein
MLAMLTRSPKKAASSLRRHAHPGVEQLETRYCPSSLQILSFTATPENSGKWVDLHGTISDPNPASVAITFSGVASGTAYANASGTFDLEVVASSLGVVSASGMDLSGSTASANATVTDVAPTLTMNLAYGANKTVILSGKVTDAQAGGMVVTFSGVATGTTTTDANGNYSVTLTPTALGQITATTTDVWGLSSAAASVTVTNTAPTITLVATQHGNIWTFSGHVTDDYATGLVVTFSGPADINGKTAVVGGDGNFSLTVVLSPNDAGWITATVTDWWGIAAEAQFCMPSQKTGGG